MKASNIIVLMLLSNCRFAVSNFGQVPATAKTITLAFLRPMTTTTRSQTNKKKKQNVTQSNKETPEKAASSVQKKTRKTRSIKSQTTTTSAAAAASSSGPQPWYHFFTKGDPEYDEYMKHEWGYEKRGDSALFEALSLEGAQAGLSWLTILRKRDAYRKAFANFDIDTVASYTDEDVERIVAQQPSSKNNTREIVVRHRGKIESVIQNAKCIQQLRSNDKSSSQYQDWDQFMWSFVKDQPILNCFNSISTSREDDDAIGNETTNNKSTLSQFPTKTSESIAMSQELKRLGFRFVGPTTCYAFMQNVGMVIDHPMHTPEWREAFERLQQRPGGYQERKG